MTKMTDKTPCRTPNSGGVTNIPAWKFDACRRVILQSLADGGYPFQDMVERCAPLLNDQELSDLGSVKWHIVTTKLELEVRGELRRIAGVKPQFVERV